MKLFKRRDQAPRPMTGEEIAREIDLRTKPYPPGPAVSAMANHIRDELQAYLAIQGARAGTDDLTLRLGDLEQLAQMIAAEIDWAFEVSDTKRPPLADPPSAGIAAWPPDVRRVIVENWTVPGIREAPEIAATLLTVVGQVVVGLAMGAEAPEVSARLRTARGRLLHLPADDANDDRVAALIIERHGRRAAERGVSK